MHQGSVIKTFMDRHTHKLYYPGNDYLSEDKDRLSQLADMGYVEVDEKDMKEVGAEVKRKTEKEKIGRAKGSRKA